MKRVNGESGQPLAIRFSQRGGLAGDCYCILRFLTFKFRLWLQCSQNYGSCFLFDFKAFDYGRPPSLRDKPDYHAAVPEFLRRMFANEI
jgi:hypothetical protein